MKHIVRCYMTLFILKKAFDAEGSPDQKRVSNFTLWEHFTL